MTNPLLGADFVPAFPVRHDLSGDGKSVMYHSGMSLRDYFAAQALNSVYFNPSLGDEAKEIADMARMVYAVADAMLRERAK